MSARLSDTLNFKAAYEQHAAMPEPALSPRSSSLEFRVRFCETDLMGIVHHANYLAYFEMGRVDWLRKRGITYATWAERGLHLPVVEVTLRYKAPSRFDDLLTLQTELVDLRTHSLRYAYRLYREGLLLTEGETRLACTNGSGRLQQFTREMLAVLESPEIPQEIYPNPPRIA